MNAGPTDFNTTELLKAKAGAVVALAFPERGDTHELRVRVLRKMSCRIDLRLDLGAETAAVSFFDTNTAKGGSYAAKEIALLSKYSETGLTPRAKGFANNGDFVVCDWIDGHAFSGQVEAERLHNVATCLGAWARAFHDFADPYEAGGNWFDYLSEYDAFGLGDGLRRYEGLLRGLTFGEKRIAANVSHLDCFAETSSGALQVVNLSSASLKPPGWDLLISARLLAQRFPEDANAIAAALSLGWCGEDRSTDYQAMVSLIKVFLIGAVFTPTEANRPHLARLLDGYNAEHDTAIKQAFFAPYLDRPLVPPTPAERDAFATYLRQERLRAEAEEVAQSKDKAPFQPTEPQAQVLQAMCAHCQGHCCMPGLGKHAFLTAADLVAKAGSRDSAALEAAEAYYLDALPDRHVEGSCLYHGEQGCVLPRPVRAPLCHTYYCRPAQSVFDRIKDRDAIGDVLFVTKDQPKIKRSAFKAKAPDTETL